MKVKSLSCVRLLATPWTVAYQAPLSMGFSRQEYWSGLPFPSPGDLPDPGIEPRFPALQGDSLLSEPPAAKAVREAGTQQKARLISLSDNVGKKRTVSISPTSSSRRENLKAGKKSLQLAIQRLTSYCPLVNLIDLSQPAHHQGS